MYRRTTTLNPSTPEDQLAWLLLRVIAQLSPCTEATLAGHVAWGEDDGFAFATRLQGRLGNALKKLGDLAFIRLAGEHIVITEEGLRVLDRPQIAAAPERHDPSAETSRTGGDTVEDIGHALSTALARMSEAIAATKKTQTGEAPPREMLFAEASGFPWSALRPDAEMQIVTVNGDVAIACRGVGRIDGFAEGEEMRSGVSSYFMPGARHSVPPWRRYTGLLQTPRTRALAEYGSRLKRFCLHRLADNRLGRNGASTAALQAWMRPVVAAVEARATALAPRLTWLATVCRTRGEACAMIVGRWGRQVGAGLRKLLPRTRFAGRGRSPLFILGCGLLAVGTLAVAGSAALLSRGPTAPAARVPVVWQFDRPDRPIFATQKTGKDVWIKGISIRGENISNETLTDIHGTLKPDRSDAEIKLGVSLAGDAAAREIPPGATFTLSYAFPQAAAPGEQVGISAEEFLATYGGLIFAFHYTLSGNETTRIEYLSPKMLGAQLAEVEGPAPR